MPSVESITRVTGEIYDAAADPRLWPSVVEGLRRELNAAGSGLVEYDFAGQSCRVLAYAGTHPSFVHAVQHGVARQIPWIQDGPWYVSGRVSRGHEIIPDEELARSPAYNEWLKPQGFFHRLCGVIRRREGRVLFVVAARPPAQGRYDEGEARFLSGMLPHLRRATRLSRTFLRAQAMATAFEQLPYGAFILDGSGRPVLMNQTGEDLLARGTGLRLDHSGRLAAADTAATAQLRSAFAGLDNGAREPRVAGGASVRCRGSSDRPPLPLTIVPLGPRSRDLMAGEGRVLVLAVPPRAAECQEGQLRASYGLTAAEERLARLIVQGHRLDQAEVALGIRHSTARTHMKRIYAKTGTRRQAELVRLLMTGKPPAGSPDGDEELRKA
jgi:DNA-binding CsgD family transcriptional regulator/PAS domain-containing protein